MASEARVPKTGELIAGQLRKAILRGQLKPGDRLPPEAQLMASYQVSRPTIREALRILEFESLVQVSRGVLGGARVRPPSNDLVSHAAGMALGRRGVTLAEVHEVRAVIEPMAAAFAAQRASQSCARALKAILAELEKSTDDDDFVAKVYKLHTTLIETCGNGGVAVIAQALQEILGERVYVALFPGPSEAVKQELAAECRGSFAELISYIEKGDSEGAEAHWKRHLDRMGGTLGMDRLREMRVADFLSD